MAQRMLIEYMNKILDLDIKPDWKMTKAMYEDRNGKASGSLLDYMGFRFHGGNIVSKGYLGKQVKYRKTWVTIRKRIFLAARRKRKIFSDKLRKKIQVKMKFVQSVVSQFGWFKSTNMAHYRKKNRVDQLIKIARKIVSDYAKGTQLPESEEGPQGVEADEIYFKVTVSTVTKEEISADIDFWFDQLKEKEEGLNADYLSIETYRANKKKEISQICQSTVFAGVDISISSGTEHFSLKDEDQLNLFGKQAQLTAGIKKLEYHEDGNPCRYYSAEDMQKIINGAMEFKSYHTTYANSLNMWIKGCSKASEIAKIEYGAPIPEEYQSEVLKDYLAEMAADKEVK